MRKFQDDNADVSVICGFSTLLAVGVFYASMQIFVKEPCQLNSYLQNGQCLPCLPQLKNCKECTEFNKCDLCEDNFFLEEVEIKKNLMQDTCLSCFEKHNENCVSCNSTTCLKCTEGMSLVDNKCYDCKYYPNSLSCDDKGALTCGPSFYLKTESDGSRYCEKCKSAKLQNCLECSDADTCTKCESDFFTLTKRGQCTCKGGKNAYYDEDTNTCGCGTEKQ